MGFIAIKKFCCEARLRSEGLVPWTVERNVVSADAPLKAVTELRIAAMA